jgi:hypothetical protein
LAASGAAAVSAIVYESTAVLFEAKEAVLICLVCVSRIEVLEFLRGVVRVRRNLEKRQQKKKVVSKEDKEVNNKNSVQGRNFRRQ